MNRNKILVLGFFMILMVFVRPVYAESQDKVNPPEDETGTIKSVEPQDPIPVSDKEDRSIVIQPRGNDLITVNFIDVDIREALSTISMGQEIDVALAKDVSGDISVHLYHVPLDKALDAITMAGGFDYQKRGNLYYVYKPKEARDPQADMLQMRVFKLKYAKIDKIQGILESIPSMRLIKTHKPSKTIIVEDTAENIEKVEKIIRHWDTVPKQVMIEAKILQVALNDDMVLGVDWEKLLRDVRIGTGGFSNAVIRDFAGEAVSPVPETGQGIFGNVTIVAGARDRFTAALEALQEKTRVNTISTPKILAVHSKLARVQVGGQQGYRVTTISDGLATESIEFINTGLILEVTPYINDNGTVLLEVRPSITSVEIEEGIPVTSTTTVTTWMMANNGETILIGGLIKNTKIRTSEQVPLIGSIPVLGALFGRNVRIAGKTELVILITSHIFDAGQGIKYQEIIEKTEKVEQNIKKEPVPDHKQFLDLLSPVE